MKRIYRIENGEVFAGTLEQFRSCFFSDAIHEQIIDWCMTMPNMVYDHKTLKLEWSDDSGLNWVSNAVQV
jgi:hypothetical protein